MVVPYGFGVGDFVAVGTLAWNVYKSCKAAPGSFSNISNEVLSLHAVLKEADETIFRSPLSPESQARLKTIGDGCQRVLGDLQALVDKYEKLGTQSKRTWDRMKWGAEDIVEIRSRLISNATMLTAFISTSQTSVEQKLDKLISDFQQGKRAPSVVSLQTVDSLHPDDKEAWRNIRKELEDIGISVAAFDANKDFIFEWFSNAIDTGTFQEQTVSSPPGSVHSLDAQSSTSSLSRWVKESNKKAVMSDTEPPKASKAKTKPTGNYTIMQAEQASNGIGATEGPHAPAIPTKVPRFAAFLASLSQPKKRLNDALLARDLDRVRKILNDPATSRLIDKPTLNNALDRAIRATSKEACALLIDAGADIIDGSLYRYPLTMAVSKGERDLAAFLLDRGADVNCQSETGKPLLTLAVCNAKRDLAAFLLDRGADVNYQSENRETPLTIAVRHGKRDFAALLLDRGADVNHQSENGETPLTMAVRHGKSDFAAFLLDRGADVNYQSENRETPLTIAVRHGKRDFAALLLDRGADVNHQSENGETPLTMAVRHGKSDFAAFLLDRGADVNYQSGDGTAYSSALRAAITNDDEATITLLSQRGADLNAVQRCNKNKYSGYPTGIHQASARHGLTIVDLLINLGADFNSPQKHYGTPLMLSIYNGCFSTAELLIQRGANINEVGVPLKHRERLFHSAIRIAIYVSSPYLVALLLHNGVGTDLNEAYEFAAQHTVLLSRRLMPSGSMSYQIPHPDDPAKQFFDWETRIVRELSKDARQVQKLLKEQKEKSAVQA